MTRVGAIDCGTNSIRLLVADVTTASKESAPRLIDLHREMRVVRLGQGVDRTGRLADDAIARTLAALRDYSALLDTFGVEQTRMVATSATRDAENSSAFVDEVEQILGVQPDVVSGDDEANLSFAGATAELEKAGAPFLVVDIGGGSTEFVLGDDRPTAAVSVDVGCVRLTERHLGADPPTAAQVEAARADVRQALVRVRAVVPVADARTLVGVAGSVTTVAAIALGLSAYDPDPIHRSRISRSDVHAVTDSLLGMTRAQRAALPVMHPGRVDVIGAGALVLDEVMHALDLDEVLVSEHDILDGIALSAARR